MSDCLFCKIIRKEIPAEIVYEDDATLVFVDIKPINQGHLLVVPKTHSTDLASASDEAITAATVVAKKMGKAVMEALQAPAFNLVVNNGRAAGQLVDHLHVHVIPRFENDGHEHWHGGTYAEGEMQEVGQKLREVLA